jgi:F-type H+-transporting ATPase subunit a
MALSSVILAAADPASHVYNHWFIKSGSGLWLWSGNQGNLVLSGIILILVGLWVASKVKTGPESQGHDRYVTKSRFAHMIEVICVYLREEVVRPMLGDRTDRLMPFLWTIFFFILVNNVLGLLPIMDLVHLASPGLAAEHRTWIGGTATQNLWVTGMLALVAGLVFNVAAVKRLGVTGYFGHMTGGAPWYVAWMIFIIELAGQVLIKPAALAIRLFANMTAGHILLATLFLFVAQVWGKGLALSGPVTLLSVGGAVAIMFLELFVAFLQAFIFLFLTAVFISLMDHHDEHGHEHEHGHAHGHEHAPSHA